MTVNIVLIMKNQKDVLQTNNAHWKWEKGVRKKKISDYRPVQEIKKVIVPMGMMKEHVLAFA